MGKDKLKIHTSLPNRQSNKFRLLFVNLEILITL